MKKNILESVKNPLSVIVIFAGLSEIAMTVTLVKLPLECQKIFLWFVMLFPLILVGAFFFILYKKPAVLFSPADYQKDELYLSSISNDKGIDNIIQRVGQLEEISKSIQSYLNTLAETAISDADRESISEEKKRLYELRQIQTLEKNNLYMFLHNEIKLEYSLIRNIICNTESGYDLPDKIYEITKNDNAKIRFQNVIENFPNALSDYDKLKDFFKSEV